jgi:hypothetical protein
VSLRQVSRWQVRARAFFILDALRMRVNIDPLDIG